MTNKSMIIGLSLAPTWVSGSSWRQSDSQIEAFYDIDYYIDLAKRAEALKLDFVFRPDSLFVDYAELENSPGFSGLDPTLLLTAVATHTQRIGLITTASTTFNQPFHVARQLQSLNWISKGRIAWNIVTALDGQQNFGLEVMPPADEKYTQAAEFTEIVKSLWQSFPNHSLCFNRDTGQYANSTQIQPINHNGNYFKVAGPLSIPAFKDETLPIVQAGASDTGKEFAATVAHAIFAATPNKQVAISLRNELRQRANKLGRDGSDIRVLSGVSLFLAESEAQAKQLYSETQSSKSLSKRIGFIKQATGIDVSTLASDAVICAAMLQPVSVAPRSRTHAQLLRNKIEQQPITVDELLKSPEVAASSHWQIIGTVSQAADEIADWFNDGAIDGVILLPGGATSSLNLALDKLVPELINRGVFHNSYDSDTFLSHLRAK